MLIREDSVGGKEGASEAVLLCFKEKLPLDGHTLVTINLEQSVHSRNNFDVKGFNLLF